MNEIILAPCDVITKIKQNSSDMNEIILSPCDAGYVQSCTGFSWSTIKITTIVLLYFYKHLFGISNTNLPNGISITSA
jgi:hypothetical protein